ncbi:MAG: substrate-binding domain-containing protein [Verrucomicrobia bacterium]|nr:substrate-binding domain-containing protein [Verrucomicrobiota bacterium]
MADSKFFPQYKKVAEIVRKRIIQGSYSIKLFPSERRLAEELGVNYMTVRRGLQILEKENILTRLPNGRMRVKRIQQGVKNHLNFGFLTPTFTSGAVESWRLAIDKVSSTLPCSVRPILYMHWDDPILMDALDGFDGVFLISIPEKIPDPVAKKLREQEHPVVVIDQDLTAMGAPSIQLFPPVFVQKLLDHFDAGGHRRIGCFNTQAHTPDVDDRINQWRYWMNAHGFTGRLVDEPASSYGDPVECAYESMKRLLKNGKPPETAWLFITMPAALGAMRALLDRGIKPGIDVAMGAVDGERLASMLNPPLTALEPPDPTPFISVCLDWMMKGGRQWQGPLLMRPSDVPLVIRESSQTGAGRGLTA